ncbi:MAG: hypothetical protein JNM81_09850 [Rhodospirillaceae bacterium]|nr:hypothetical protein [Rhodospirillaceae bacterium]
MVSKTVLPGIAGLVFMGLAGSGLAQAPAPSLSAPTVPPQKPLSAERLAMPLFPAGWKEVVTDRGNIDVIEYVPNGENITAWRNKITLEVYHEMNTLPLDAMQRRAQGQNRDACEGAVEGRFQSGMNNGYPSAFWVLGCKRNRDSGMGETRYTKAIQGSQRMYILTRAWRTPAFGDNGPEIPQRALEDAVAFLTTTVACSDDDSKHACPATSKK